MYFDEEENPNKIPSLEFSILDRANIEDLEIGDPLYKSETGEFSVQLVAQGYRVNTKSDHFAFKNIQDTFEFLENNS